MGRPRFRWTERCVEVLPVVDGSITVTGMGRMTTQSIPEGSQIRVEYEKQITDWGWPGHMAVYIVRLLLWRIIKRGQRTPREQAEQLARAAKEIP